MNVIYIYKHDSKPHKSHASGVTVHDTNKIAVGQEHTITLIGYNFSRVA